MTDAALEINFDGIVGPTHNYAGLSHGNVASARHGGQTANPRAAALQGLAKMKLLADLGVRQAVLPPHERPSIDLLRRLGFTGSEERVLADARQHDPVLPAIASSASSMWAANAATVSPSADSLDGRVHFTAANLIGNAHRACEAAFTATVLRHLFADERRFAHHDPLPGALPFGDEGAANHTRLCRNDGGRGVQLFVYGRRALTDHASAPHRYPARQTLEAAQAVARLHELDPQAVLFAQQHPAAIDAGVFHNDVIAVGNAGVFLCHAQAFCDQPAVLDNLRRTFARTCGKDLIVIEASARDVSLADAVDTYLFNSQLVTLPAGDMALICPIQCRRHPATRAWLDRLVAEDNPITRVHDVDLLQSMQNGGGPACLRLRIVLTEQELSRTHQGVIWTEALHARLQTWVQKHYRDSVSPNDLADPQLLRQSRAALDELTNILDLGSIYPFQRGGA